MSERIEQTADPNYKVPAAIPADVEAAPAAMGQEEIAAREKARRYRRQFVDLNPD